ncbi:hypothetical protein GCM10023116_13020 [Kistimonas scapharcae]|uniref:Ribokinase n=1 Tax=Kistimonas scapharcae TaxID=1036133 RepID=A0ABP8V0R8_9GAMM
MEPLTIIKAASLIADITGVGEWIGKLLGGDKGETVAREVINQAQVLTGASSMDEAIAVLNADKAKARALRERLIEHRETLIRLANEDRQNARALYEKKNATADKVADRIMKWNLPLIALLVSGYVLIFIYVPERDPAVLASSALTLVLKGLLDERTTLIQFFFGASSKDEVNEPGG